MTQDIRQWIRELQAGHNIVSQKYPALARSVKSKRKKQGKKLLRKYVWDAFDNQFDLNEIMSNNEKIFLGVSDFEDLVTVEIMKRRVDAKLSTVQRETTVLCDRQRWSKWAEVHYKDCLFVQNNSSTGFIIEENTHNFIKFDVNSNSTTVRAFGDVEFAEDMIAIVESNFDVVSSYIEWVYGSDGNSVNVPLNRDRLPTEEMYPFLNGESLGDYYDRYMESSANILLLIGPPGTGKTTFIRGLLAHRNCSAIVTYDAGILEKDGFFAKFIEDDAEVMVLEDSDAFLKSRSDGNTMMHRFLNVGDGLVTTKGKKMIFSTNLPSIRDIDSALIRPGRCFDIVTFDVLNADAAKSLAKKLKVKLPEVKDTYSIAEVFNQQSDNTKKSSTNRKVGFL
jgi:tRNA uridine 5-carbamoylmethylation protein Kti12